MNKEQADCLKYNTCGMVQYMESILESMKVNGLPKKEIKIVDNAIDNILELNQKYVRLSK